MRTLLIGATGRLGSALHHELRTRGHDVTTVARTGGDHHLDLTDPEHATHLWERVGAVDAVVSAAGDVPYKPLDRMGAHDYQAAFTGKVLTQIGLVTHGTHHVSPHGSFTLITGSPGRDPVAQGSAAAMANGAVEAFVRTAAVEIAPQRVNAVSPAVFTESLADFGDFFPGLAPVDLAEVTRAYVRSIEGAQTGQVYIP
ncbi:short chain dehydrogenase [Nocardiopsis oceani]